MTARDIIALVDNVEPNGYEYELKEAWLTEFEGQIYEEIISKHAGGDIKNPSATGKGDRELLIPFPYGGEIYSHLLQMRIAEKNAEMDKYNVQAALFNSAYERYTQWYTRNHMPLSRGNYFKF